MSNIIYALFISIITTLSANFQAATTAVQTVDDPDAVTVGLCYTVNDEYADTTYSNILTDESKVNYYISALENLDDTHTATYDEEASEICASVTIIHDYYTVLYQFIMLETENGEDIPAIKVFADGNPYYALTQSEYDELLKNIEADASAKGCEIQTTWTSHPEEYYEITDSNDKGDIIFISDYTNYAEGFMCKGFFIDEYGYVYRYNLSNHDFTYDMNTYDYANTNEAFLAALYNEIYYKQAPYAVVDEDYMEQLSDVMNEVNVNAKWTEESVACDAGQHTLYALEGSELIAIQSLGDWDGYLNDDSAKELAELFDNLEQYETKLD